MLGIFDIAGARDFQYDRYPSFSLYLMLGNFSMPGIFKFHCN